jgi:Zn-dependent protease with chaperone function
MTRLPLTICLALTWFFAVNTLVSVAVAAASRWYSTLGARRGETAMDRQLARAWRLLPAGLSSAVVAVFMPAFLAYEPSGSPEPVGWTLRLTAVATLALVAAGCGRGAMLTRRARSIVDRLQVDAVPLELPGLSGTRIRAYAVHDAFPVVSLVGVWRPRLFVARQVLAVLSATELKAAVEHELAHSRAWDNAIRVLYAWTPDLLGWLPAGRRLERLWAAAAERAADRTAAQGSETRGVDLAGALVKVSRLAAAPASAPGVPLFSTFHECGEIADRVRRLVSASSAERRCRSGLPALGVAAALVGCASSPKTWQMLYALSEACVRFLP